MNPSIIKITEDNMESIADDFIATRKFDHVFMKTHDMEQSESFVRETLFRHSPMIYTPGTQKESIGTSIYIVFNQRKYILTAGHLFTNGKPATHKKPERIDISNVYIGNNVRLLDLNRGLIFPPAEDNDYHEMDYALFLVNDEISSVLERVYLPFPIPTTESITAYYPQYGFLHGYPCNKNKNNRFSKNIDTDLCIRAPLDLESLKTGNNIIFHCDRNKASTLNEMKKNQSHTMCKINGMSGCGIWDIMNYPIERDYHNWSIALCGILTNYSNETKRLIGLHVCDIIEFLKLATETIVKMKEDKIGYCYKND